MPCASSAPEDSPSAWASENCGSPAIGSPCTRGNLTGDTTFNKTSNFLTNVSKLTKNYDVNPGVGGPLKQDKAWFYATFRYLGVNKTVADTTALTLEIAGTNPGEQAITAVEKGLRGQLIDAQALIKNLILEQEYLQTPLTNYRVDLELHKRRQATLEARLRELSTTAMR